MSSTPMGRAMRTLETLPGIVVEPVEFHGQPSYQVTMTDEARALLSEMMGVRPPLVERVISTRVMSNLPLFTQRVTELTPDQEGK